MGTFRCCKWDEDVVNFHMVTIRLLSVRTSENAGGRVAAWPCCYGFEVDGPVTHHSDLPMRQDGEFDSSDPSLLQCRLFDALTSSAIRFAEAKQKEFGPV